MNGFGLEQLVMHPDLGREEPAVRRILLVAGHGRATQREVRLSRIVAAALRLGT